MKFRLHFKTPDVLDQLCEESYTEEEWNEIKKLVDKHIEYSEYVRIEFDTETQTGVVV